MEFRKVGERDGLLLLADEAGNHAAFDFLEMAVVNGREYAALLQQGETEPTVLRLRETGGEEIYAVIEDDAEFDAALDALDAALTAED